MKIFRSPRVALIGFTGNLGQIVHSRLLDEGVEVQLIGRKGNNLADGWLIPFEGIETINDLTPEVIINLSNFYSPNPQGPDYEKMKDSIVGVASAIAKYNQSHAISVISASTYFQYCPKEMSPWSTYAQLKSDAQNLLISESDKLGVKFTDYVLYDNYGGSRRDKFLDIALQALFSEKPIPATNGEQIVNLTHIEDIASAIVSETHKNRVKAENDVRIFQLQSSETYSLKGLSLFISEVTSIEPNIAWGSLPYREKEIFQSWDTGLKNPASWIPKHALRDYIKLTCDLLKKEKKGSQ